MGDPKKRRKKYSTPVHPWQKERIDEEKELKKEFGLKNKKEIWKMKAKLDHYAQTVKNIISKSGEEVNKDSETLLKKLQEQGLITQDAKLDDVLSLTLKDILERRLQTVVFRKGYARSISQARQFITHEHITVNGKKINSPAYMVSVSEEANINFAQSSAIADSEHPERKVMETAEAPKPEAEKKEKEKAPKKSEKKEAKKEDKKEK